MLNLTQSLGSLMDYMQNARHITETENEQNSKSVMHLDYTPQSTVLDFPKSNAPSVDCHMGQPDDCGHNQW